MSTLEELVKVRDEKLALYRISIVKGRNYAERIAAVLVTLAVRTDVRGRETYSLEHNGVIFRCSTSAVRYDTVKQALITTSLIAVVCDCIKLRIRLYETNGIISYDAIDPETEELCIESQLWVDALASLEQMAEYRRMGTEITALQNEIGKLDSLLGLTS